MAGQIWYMRVVLCFQNILLAPEMVFLLLQARCSAEIVGTVLADDCNNEPGKCGQLNTEQPDLSRHTCTAVPAGDHFGLCCRLRLCAVCKVEPGGSRHGSAQQQDAARHLRSPPGGQIRRRQAERPHIPPREFTPHFEQAQNSSNSPHAGFRPGFLFCL